MLRKLVNEAQVDLVLEPGDPLLIAAGAANAVGLNMPFVVTYRNGGRGEPYLPGSSLKGVLRSHAERISRTLAPHAGVCDPFLSDRDAQSSDRIASCGDRLSARRGQNAAPQSPQARYQSSCPICRTFGSTLYRGRFAIGDAMLVGTDFRLEQRDGVGIDRFSGGAAATAKFELEVLTRGKFQTRIRLENFEDWQLGLLALLCRDLEDGLISVGHGTSRGLGRLKALISAFEVRYIAHPSRQMTDTRVFGVGSLVPEAEASAYGYIADDFFDLTHAAPFDPSSPIRRTQKFSLPEMRRAFFDDAVARWAERMSQARSTGRARA